MPYCSLFLPDLPDSSQISPMDGKIFPAQEIIVIL